MAATIGVGNIAGVATAIALGGPGAIFWMWMVALVGMATKLAEATLGVKYRQVDADGKVSGGVFYYIENGLGRRWKWLALIYAFLAGLAAFGIGNMVQANTMAHALDSGMGIPNWVTGILVMIAVGLVTLGGIKRIAVTAARIVPTMALIYVIGAIGVLVSFYDQIPAAFAQIFAGAFSTSSAVGGFAGATMAMAVRYGIARGIFSNEAGLGSASIVHAQARNKPYAQGLWGMWEVFIDTLVVCTMTALVILVTGVIQTGQTGAELTTSAFSSGLPGIGSWIVLVSIVLFSYSTMLTWNFYGEKSWEYAFGPKVVTPYRLLFIAFLFLGAIGGLTVVWDVADTLNGLMAAPEPARPAAAGRGSGEGKGAVHEGRTRRRGRPQARGKAGPASRILTCHSELGRPQGPGYHPAPSGSRIGLRPSGMTGNGMIGPCPHPLTADLLARYHPRMEPIIELRAADPDTLREAERLGLHPVVARVLANRADRAGVAPDWLLDFSLRSLDPPDGLPDIEAAAERIAGAVVQGEVIALATDADSDGVNASTVLTRALREHFGHPADRVQHYIGLKLSEGYGLSDSVCDRILAADPRPGLVITADIGSSDGPRIARLAGAGIDVVVTDHHGIPPDGGPEAAFAFVNPSAPVAATRIRWSPG
jgi:alanine or glycine:cation symporter, AGCS family